MWRLINKIKKFWGFSLIGCPYNYRIGIDYLREPKDCNICLKNKKCEKKWLEGRNK